MNSEEAAKRAAAAAAIQFVESQPIIGVGTGSTVAHFLDAVASATVWPSRAVSTSDDTDTRLKQLGIEVVGLENAALPLSVYIDGADEIDGCGRAIKGGGGAHTREKAVAQASRTWVCIVDDTKVVSSLGSRSPVPIEIADDTLPAVLETLEGMGAHPAIRECTRIGTTIVDVHGFDLRHPLAVERRLESIAGVIACGIFAHRRADVILVGHANGSVTKVEPDRERGAE